MTGAPVAPKPEVGGETWTERNQRLLSGQLNRLHARLSGAEAGVDPELPDTLAALAAAFGLSTFERDLLLWCAGVELDSRFASPPTFGLALSVLDDPHWDALSPARPLRRWRLIELIPGQGLVASVLRVDERVLHHLTGVDYLDPGLDGVARLVTDRGQLTAAQAAVATDLGQVPPGRVVIALEGGDRATRARIAAHVAPAVLVVQADRLPPDGPQNTALARLVERECVLLGAVALVESGAAAADLVAAIVGELCCAVLVGAAAPVPGLRADISRTVPAASSAERRELWLRALNGHGPAMQTVAIEAAGHFSFEAVDIEAVVAGLDGADDPAVLRQRCRVRARCGLEDLAERIEPHAGWSDLILPEQQFDVLRDIGGQVRYRSRVYDDWGMAAPGSRGLGVTALFVGESGTGKTLAAEVLAASLDLDLYRIDLAAVVSKYIGETEKNLKRVFDAADASGAVLLFDEADAIFGKRSEVRDSHDRYANLEISYLLQRMETYRGLAILTTNLRSALDRSFLRRIGFAVTFPFPDPAARARIWRLMFPASVPLSGVDWHRLARLQVPGGHIRTIALGAAFLAAGSDGPITMAHLLAAARREYAKLEKPLTEAEIGGWV